MPVSENPSTPCTLNLMPIPLQLKVRAQEHGQDTAYAVHTAEGWEKHTWRDYEQQVLSVTRSLLYLGLEVGQSACILGNNCP